MYKKEAEKRCVFRLDLKACKVLDDVTSDVFHVSSVATGKARSPVVRSHVAGKASAEVEDERSHCQPGI